MGMREKWKPLSFYEILSGLKHRDAYRQLETFYEFAESNSILPLTETSVSISSDIYAALRKSGNPLDDTDILIAGIALANDFILVTHNIDHLCIPYQAVNRMDCDQETNAFSYPIREGLQQ